MREQEFRLWQHEPITRAFLQYLDDQVANWRELAADIVEIGGFTAGDRLEGRNPDVVRGKIVALKELRRLTLAEIQDFYREATRDSQDDQADGLRSGFDPAGGPDVAS